MVHSSVSDFYSYPSKESDQVACEGNQSSRSTRERGRGILLAKKTKESTAEGTELERNRTPVLTISLCYPVVSRGIDWSPRKNEKHAHADTQRHENLLVDGVSSIAWEGTIHHLQFAMEVK